MPILRQPKLSKQRTDAMRVAELIDIHDKEGVLWGSCLTDTFFASWDAVKVGAIGGRAIAVPIWLLDKLVETKGITYLNIYLDGDSTRYLIDLDSALKCTLSWASNGEKCLILDKGLFFDRRTRLSRKPK